MSDSHRYLDAASATPLHPVARQALLAALEDGWADPGRLYGAGRRARLLLDAARESTAECLGARPDEVSFTANGTQALHAAALGSLAAGRGGPFVHTAVEHSALLHVAEAYDGPTVSIGVDALGRVDVEAFVAAARNSPAVAVQAANHEVGTTQPVDAIAGELPGVPLIVDATQTLGHAEVPAGWSVLAADAHTWGGPSGVGVLAVRTGTRWRSPYPADDREAGRIPGTPDVAAIVAAAASLRAVCAAQGSEAARLSALIDRVRATVAATVPDVEVLGDPVGRLPHIVTFSCLYVDGEALLTALDKRGFAVSSGSSCTSSTLQPSHVLVAMGALTSGNVRVSLHHATTEADVDDFLHVLPGVVAEVRDELGAAGL
ncbi:MAG TPA: aminotransferase class V-fold PLP-dependent enzyme [Jatrophihabitantaceae bacterium]|nr:aminotransferase class V-fold PLP-dependent enzyme [Jatrophihabitantaceae bacterium]